MAEYQDREHFIPLRKSDLIELLSRDKQLSAAEREPFRQFCTLVSAVFHFEYLRQLEDLKDTYAPFDPDADTKPLQPVSDAQRLKNEVELFEKFTSLMERANFKRLKREEVERALQEVASVSGINTHVDLGMFESLELFVRGDVMGTHSPPLVGQAGQNGRNPHPALPAPRADREASAAQATRPRHRHLAGVPEDFQGHPQGGSGYALARRTVRFSRLDQALIIYPLAAGIGLTLYNIGASIMESSLAAAGSLVTWGLAGAIGGYGYKSYHSYQVKKQDYSLKLTKSLYYKSLDNNTGVLMRLLDEAEEQECRETFLAYFCLWKYAPPEGWTAEQLDDYVELYLEGNANLKVDFEIGDALAKLERLKIVRKIGDSLPRPTARQGVGDARLDVGQLFQVQSVGTGASRRSSNLSSRLAEATRPQVKLWRSNAKWRSTSSDVPNGSPLGRMVVGSLSTVPTFSASSTASTPRPRQATSNSVCRSCLWSGRLANPTRPSVFRGEPSMRSGSLPIASARSSEVLSEPEA